LFFFFSYLSFSHAFLKSVLVVPLSSLSFFAIRFLLRFLQMLLARSRGVGMLLSLCESGFLAASATHSQHAPDSFAVKLNLFPPSPSDPKIQVCQRFAAYVPSQIYALNGICSKFKIDELENKLSAMERNMLQQVRPCIVGC
jgi:hypothetical protein